VGVVVFYFGNLIFIPMAVNLFHVAFVEGLGALCDLIRRWMCGVSIYVLAISSVFVPGNVLADAGRPNILFILTDDQAYETVGAFGHTDIETPGIDRLVERGMTFTHAYNMGSWSGAVCIPSRAMLITGRGLWDVEKVHGEMDGEREAGVLWPQLMAGAGYRTYFSGKWHIPTDAAKVFDVVRHVRPGMPRDTPEAYDRPREGEPDRWSPYDRGQGGFWAGGKHWSEVLAEDAEEFIADAKGREEPFFMYLAFNAPHDPRQSPEEYVEKYPLERIEVPESFLSEYPYNGEIGSGRDLRDERLGPFPRTEHAVKVHRQEYYAMITHLDTQVGRILDALEASGMADNTWIFFTSDHGLAVGHHGLFGKQNLYDHSVRVPFIVVGPGVPVNRRHGAAVYYQDVMPTALELAGVEKPEHVYFRSLVSLIDGSREESQYGAVYGAYRNLQRSISDEGWKLIVYPGAGVVRLYNLREDPLELNDLAGDPVQAGRVAEMVGRLRVLQKEMGDGLELGQVGIGE